MLPNFFIVGAQKCGTTSLHSYLESHPELYLPPGKETKFFVDDARYVKGVQYYQDHWFAGAMSGQLIGEVDPDYMYFEVVLERMAEVLDLKKTKFIFVFREPVSRAFSHYLMSYRRGIEPLSFEQAIAAEPERIRRGYYERLHYSYLDRGYYYRQVIRFMQRVDEKQVLFILAEDLSQASERVMAEVFQFLGVDSRLDANEWRRQHTVTVPKSPRLTQAVISQGLHKSIIRLLIPFSGPRKKLRQFILDWNQTEKINIILNVNTRDRLRAMFREENEKLSGLIGRDLAHWM